MHSLTSENSDFWEITKEDVEDRINWVPKQ